MALTNVYTGANGTLTLASEDTPEGQDASAVMTTYEMTTVGRVTNVEVHVQTELEEFHEIGRRHAVSLHPGDIHVSGNVPGLHQWCTLVSPDGSRLRSHQYRRTVCAAYLQYHPGSS